MSANSKWADYLVSAAEYDDYKRHILRLKVHKDFGGSVGESQIYLRTDVVNAIKKGIKFMTVYLVQKNGKNVYQKGALLSIIALNDKEYLRTDENAVEKDNLGNLPRF